MMDTRPQELREKLHALHNELGPEIIEKVVKPITLADGNGTDVMVLLESVVVGVIAVVARKNPESRNIVLNALMRGVKQRFDTLPESFDQGHERPL